VSVKVGPGAYTDQCVASKYRYIWIFQKIWIGWRNR